MTDTVDGTQATAAQPLVVTAPRGSKVTVPGRRGSTPDLCAPSQPGVQCGPGNGRKTSGGGSKVPHTGWPAVTGILWKVLDSSGRKKVGGAANDELLGHHGSDRIFGGPGNDILWGDWDPSNNNTHQKDVLDGGPGNDWLYPSHGTTVVKGGAGKDYVWAYYGRGTIDCGPGQDTARVKLNGPWKAAQLRAHPALLRLRLRRPRRLPEARREAQGHPHPRRVGASPRLALTYGAKAATISATTGSEPGGPSMVSVRASGSSRSCMRRNAQQRLSAATKAATRSRVAAAGRKRRTAWAACASAETRSRAMAVICARRAGRSASVRVQAIGAGLGMGVASTFKST